jgi:hypothetical protein
MFAMATPEERLSTLEGRFDTLMETLASQLEQMNKRIDDMHRRQDDLHAWLIALTALAGAQLTATVALAIAMSRLAR